MPRLPSVQSVLTVDLVTMAKIPFAALELANAPNRPLNRFVLLVRLALLMGAIWHAAMPMATVGFRTVMTTNTTMVDVMVLTAFVLNALKQGECTPLSVWANIINRHHALTQ